MVKIGIDYESPIKTVFELKRDARLIILGSVSIKKGVFLSVGEDCELSIGDKTYINENSKLLITSNYSIGRNVAIAFDTLIMSESRHVIIGGNAKAGGWIRDRVWIGARSILLPGVNIESDAVIGAGSVVAKNCSEKCFYAGNPAKLKRRDIKWK
jgi:acetyltransferase-like isoleucine patch superfamily enzyme